jgi:AraC-like DNA-binding protein
MIDSASLAMTDALGGFAGLEGRGFRTRLPVHVHATYVLGVIDSGSLLVSVKGHDFVAGPGSVLALPPFTAHRELPLSGNWSFRYLYPTEEIVRRALHAREDGAGAALAFPEPVFHDPALAARIGMAHAMVQRGDNAGMEDALAGLFHLAKARCVSGSSELRRGQQGLLAVRDALTRRPQGRITLEDMASVAGLSRFRFAHAFRNAFGISPYAYYEQVRVAFAHQLIQQGIELGAVAFQLGYADQSHMTRQFRRGSFTTPGRYARLSRGAGRSS